MPGNAREMVTTAEQSFPVRIRIGVPPGGRWRRQVRAPAITATRVGWALSRVEKFFDAYQDASLTGNG